MLYLVVIEPIETRYTGEWYEHLPKLLTRHGIENIIIEGSPKKYGTSTGAFLDFSATNIYKSEQVIKISELFSENKIKDGDHFLFLDAWHPGIINLKYMIDLNQINAQISAIWHAGSYDPYDFLGYTIKDKTWVSLVEQAYFNAIDYNFFATNFHIQMFKDNLFGETTKPIRTGFPFEYMAEMFAKYRYQKKENIILFPHRKAKEKQLDIFLDLQKTLPDYEFIICADKNLSKAEYRDLIGRSKLVFSANLQETLGISCYEILASGGACLVPNRLSYSEMYSGQLFYPSEWTTDLDSYRTNKNLLVDKIVDIMDNFESPRIQTEIGINFSYTTQHYFTAKTMLDTLLKATS